MNMKFVNLNMGDHIYLFASRTELRHFVGAVKVGSYKTFRLGLATAVALVNKDNFVCELVEEVSTNGVTFYTKYHSTPRTINGTGLYKYRYDQFSPFTYTCWCFIP